MADTRSPSPAPSRRGASTRAKVVSLAVLANMAGCVVAIFVARALRSGLGSANEGGWLFAYYTAMFVVAIFDAFLVDELLFAGTFRRTYLEGKDTRQLERSGDDEALAATFKRSSFRFPAVVVLCGGLTYLLFNAVNDDFDTYHRTIGTHLSALRSGDPDEQRAAVAELSIRRAPKVLPALEQALQAGGPAAPWAAWALSRFEEDTYRRPVIKALVAAGRSDDPAIRREALVALGRLQHRPAASYIHEEIERQVEAGETVDPRLLYALGSVQVLESVPILERLLHGADEPTQRLAAWALAQHRDQKGGREVVEILERRLPSASLPVRCAIVHALGILADEQSNAALMRAYDEATPDEQPFVCPRITMAMRPDGGDDSLELLRPERKYGMKILLSMGQMRATSPEVRATVEPWLVALTTDATTLPEVKEGAASLLAGIRGGRDDSQSKSVDEALGLD